MRRPYRKPLRLAYKRAWIAIGGATLVVLAAFGVTEGLAIADARRGDTASEMVWALLTIHPGIWASTLAAFVMLMGWVGLHFWTRRV